MRGCLTQPPPFWAVFTSLLSRVSETLTAHPQYSEVLVLKAQQLRCDVAVLRFPALKPRPQEMRWLLLNLNSSAAWAAAGPIETSNPIKQQAFNRWFILISPWP